MDIKFKENNLIKKFMNNDQLKIGIRFLTKNIPFIGLLSIVLLVSLLSDVFLTSFNLLNVLRQASINGLIAFGMMAVILSAGIDLSVGSTLAVSSVVMAQLILAGYPTTLAITVALLIGVIIGLLNGLLIAKGKLQPMIATLSTMLVFRGVTLYISNGVPVSKLGEGLIGWLGRGSFIGIPIPVYILFIIFIIFALMLKYTVIGKQIYAVGGNSKAAMLSGINVDRTILIVYSLSGLFAALAGIILTSRIDSAVPTAGQTFELNAIAAVVIGGASLTGGRGRAVGTLSGALIIAVIANGLNLLGTSAYIQQIVTGVIIILAVIFDRKK
jgi:ribose transport system permease protein